MVSWLFCFLCFASYIRLTDFQIKDEPKIQYIQIFRKDRVDRRSVGMLMVFKYDITVWRRNDLVSDCELYIIV